MRFIKSSFLSVNQETCFKITSQCRRFFTETAGKLYAKENIFDDRKLLSAFPLLPASCVESSQILLKKRNLYEREGVFPPGVIAYIAKLFQAENNREMSKKLAHLSGGRSGLAKSEKLCIKIYTGIKLQRKYNLEKNE